MDFFLVRWGVGVCSVFGMDNQTEEPENVVDEQQVDEPAALAPAPTTGAAPDR